MHMQQNFGPLNIYYVTYNRSVEGYSMKIAAGYFIHSFIYFAFCKSIQGLKQPKGYRTCHIANIIHIE